MINKWLHFIVIMIVALLKSLRFKKYDSYASLPGSRNDYDDDDDYYY